MINILRFITFLLITILTSGKVFAEDDLFGFSDLEVFSPAKETEALFDSTAPIYVITGDDIRRSGANNIAESLRLVPGLEVSRADSNKWSITSRGFGRLYDNKILVLLDGREIYSSIFTGQNWSDLQGIILEDIDRIEVIKGASSALWGANTSNGVINIITKNPRYTQGTYYDVKIGNKYKGSSVRYGGTNKNNDLFYKLYASKDILKHSKSIDNLRGNKGNAGDNWGIHRAGLKLNWQKDIYNELSFNFYINRGSIDQIILLPAISDGFSDKQKFNGYSLDLSWKKEISEKSNLLSKIYFDQTKKDSLLGLEKRKVFNFDLNYFLKLNNYLKLKSGLGFRNIRDHLEDSYINGKLVRSFTSNQQNNKLYSSFFESTLSPFPNKLDIILGTKIEDHFYTGVNHFPTAKIRYLIDNTNILWSSYSKNYRQPSRLENSLKQLSTNVSGFDIYWGHNKDFKAEKIDSYEIGYRRKLGNIGQLNISSFISKYENVRTFEKTANPLLYQVQNKLSADIRGFNADVNANINKDWNIVLGYRYLDIDLDFDNDSTDTITKFDAGVSPRNLFQIQSRYNLTQNLEFDNYLYYVDALKSVNIDSYLRYDARLGYKLNKNIDLELIGRSLLNNYERETTRSFFSTHNELGRSLQFNLKWRWNE